MAKKAYRVPVNVSRFGFWLVPDLVERARNAVDFLSGPPERLTLSGLVARGLERELERLSRKYHGGKPFPHRAGKLRPGSRPAAAGLAPSTKTRKPTHPKSRRTI